MTIFSPCSLPSSLLECQHDGWISGSLVATLEWMPQVIDEGKEREKEFESFVNYGFTILTLNYPALELFYVKEQSFNSVIHYN